ncbi:FHA domain-containing protein [Thermogemmatispora sp.]|uniref:Rv0361 family membrane protein n=1 Tax=Thermogemmatispora sp. TaxID=1968838 RepID=UPI001DFD794F|nr:FHA domain-containing protein [Thermogemmatispora sp.]MBX5452149.1 FHA domain-containing protein [Thermogemmatispora sp.]
MEASLNGPQGRIPLGPGVTTVGRAPDNQIRLDDQQVSSHHAELRAENGGYSLVDRGSTNGTFVNDQRLTSQVPRRLMPGDRIRFGGTVFTYEVSEGGAEGERTVVASPPDQFQMPAAGPSYPQMSYQGVPGAVPVPGAEAGQPPYGAPPYQPYQGYGQPPASQPGYPGQPGPFGPPPQGGPAFPPQMAGYPQLPPQSQPRRRGRAGCLIASLVVLLLVVLVLVVVLFNPFNFPGPLGLLSSSPQKTVDTFCSALKNGDYHTAYGQLSSTLQANESEQQFTRAFQAATALLGPVTTCAATDFEQNGDHATAHLSLGFQRSSRLVTGTLNFVRQDGTWKIDQAPQTQSQLQNT